MLVGVAVITKGSLRAGVMRRRRLLQLSVVVGTSALATACAAPGPPPPTQAPAAPKPTSAPTTAPVAAPTTAAAPTQAAAAQPAAPTPASAGQYQESPLFTDLVQQGKLPPVGHRLPDKPVVVQPVEKTGTYGGDWRPALLGGQDTAWLVRTLGYEHLMRWDREWKRSIPNIAESVDTNADATQFTFKLRKGLKWSDGQPFTADDVTFWYDDVLTNTELN